MRCNSMFVCNITLYNIYIYNAKYNANLVLVLYYICMYVSTTLSSMYIFIAFNLSLILFANYLLLTLSLDILCMFQNHAHLMYIV